ncbi:MAG: hypothetical protein KAY24_05170 [Candidatus Eisenbacteria sp.]|nr:hypothetical protein [Candidatus Eisenbacteria bacterium]
MKHGCSTDAVTQDLRQAHPPLDPEGIKNNPEFYRIHYRLLGEISRSDRAYNAWLNRMLRPAGIERPLDSNTIQAAFYLNEATKYLDALLDLLPKRRASALQTHPRIFECNDFRELLDVALNSSNRRLAFEAQRKMYLAKLFFDVAHTRNIQHGEEHRAFFARGMDHDIMSHTVEEKDIDIAFNISSDGVSIDYKVGRPLSNQEVWRFRRREINFMQDGRPVRIYIYFYSCRSKREVLPYRYVRGKQVYKLRTVEKWTKLSMRRDASIVNKMLRTGETNPNAIHDIIGVMFIVEDLIQVEHLKFALYDRLGGPFKIRNVVDTLSYPADRTRLNRYSGAGYCVYKGDVDVLYYPEHGTEPPYSFIVEIQLYTLETYLRTIHENHYASHHRLKRRQFLEGLAPLLFPREIYGS